MVAMLHHIALHRFLLGCFTSGSSESQKLENENENPNVGNSKAPASNTSCRHLDTGGQNSRIKSDEHE